jgi:hypothetical protein
VLLVTPLLARVLCSLLWKVNWGKPRRGLQGQLGRGKLGFKRPPIARVPRPLLRSNDLWRLALLVWEPHNKVLARSEAQQALLTLLPQQPL